jgi:hypothetical protein
MNRTRIAALLAAPALLAGCSSSQPSPHTQAPAPVAPAAADTAEATASPSLASELATRNRRDSDTVAQSIGVKVEEQTKTVAPDWFAAAATTQGRGAGSALAPKLQDAIQNAITKAGTQVTSRGGNPQSLKVERAAYTRLPTGQYAAWAAIGDGSNMGEPAPAPAPVIDLAAAAPVEPAPASAPMPTLAQPKAAIATGIEPGTKVEPASPAAATAPVAALPGLNDPKAPVATSAGGPVVTPAAPAQGDGPAVVATAAPAGAAATAATPTPAVTTTPAATKAAATTTAAAAAAPKAADATSGDAVIVLPDLKNPTAVVSTTAAANAVFPADTGNAPAWWLPGAAQRGTRVAVGVRVEGKDARECARASLKAGREQLQAAIGSDPKQLLTDKTMTVKLADGRLRTYSIVSCVGTLKSDAAAPAAK